MTYKYANFPSSTSLPCPDSKGDVTINTTAITDVWRKPPSIDSFNAPIIYKSIPISKFKSAKVTAQGDLKTLYDQGGLILVFPSTKSRPTAQKRWMKTGMEFYQGKPMMSVVSTDLWSDWSLLSLSEEDEKAKRMSVEVEREVEKDGSYGPVLKVSLVGSNGKGVPIREVTWAFYDLDESEEMWVGITAAKPIESVPNDLSVHFTGFEIILRD